MMECGSSFKFFTPSPQTILEVFYLISLPGMGRGKRRGGRDVFKFSTDQRTQYMEINKAKEINNEGRFCRLNLP